MIANDSPESVASRLMQDIGDADDAVIRVIVEAARYAPRDSKSDQAISTTRIFLGALDFGALRTSQALYALRLAIDASPNGKEALSRLSGLFRTDDNVLPRLEQGLSDNSRRLLTNALKRGHGTATAENLVETLLEPSEGRLWRRLRDYGCDVDALRMAYGRTLESVRKPADPEVDEAAQAERAGGGTEPNQVSEAASPEANQKSQADDTSDDVLSLVPETASIYVAGVANDDPWRGTAVDYIGVEAEARGFARLALRKSISPPLAVGVFGDWGRGKTFFMRQVYEAIEHLRTAPPAGDTLHTNVVQIRFNAWHYVDTNLWASLVEHIFSELDRWMISKTHRSEANTLFSRLSTARRLTLEAVQSLVERRKEQGRAVEKLDKAERALAEARAKATVQPLDVIAAFKSVFQTEMGEVDDALKDAMKKSGLDKLRGDGEAFRGALNSLTDEGRRGTVLLRQMLGQLGSRGWVLGIIVAVFAVPTGLVWLKSALQQCAMFVWLRSESATVIAASGLLTSLTVAVNRLIASAKPGLERLSALRATLDARLEEKLAEEANARTQAQADAAAKTAVVERAKSDLSAATQALAIAVDEYAAETGFRRLRRFIQGRATDGTYARHLGLVATVRRDFEQLSSLMLPEEPNAQNDAARAMYAKEVEELVAEAGAELADEEKEALRDSAKPEDAALSDETKFQRIVLYIDDLDRCPPKKVVDVLQAVHMLLTFPLFVVFVAVDARWITRALVEEYPELLTTSGGTDELEGASPHDYLEKIFQIPYWVPPLTATASQRFLQELIAPRAKTQRDAPNEESSNGLHHQEPSNAAHGGPAENPVPPGGSPGPPGGVPPNDASRPSPVPPAREAFNDLELSHDERQFMAALAQFAGSSPRRLLRFANVYRVITAAMDAEKRAALINNGEYLPLLTQLAIVTGAPSLLDQWLNLTDAEIPQTCRDETDLNPLIQWLADHERFGRPRGSGWPNLHGALTTYTKSANHGAGTQLERLRGNDRAWIEVARRYSFIG